MKNIVDGRSFILGVFVGLTAFNIAYIVFVFLVALNLISATEVGHSLLLMPIIEIPMLLGYMYVSRHYELKKKESGEVNG